MPAGVTLALLGDVMLGRRVGERIREEGPGSVVDAAVCAVLRDADAVVANLECCISERGERWPAPGKPFFFRAPPAAVEVLARLGVTAVTLANNHALDYGYDALADTLALLHAAGIRTTGAGADAGAARRPASFEVAGRPFALVGCTDHPRDFAAGPGRPGVALARLDARPDAWLLDAIRAPAGTSVVVSPHWGPNMTREPIARVRAAAAALVGAGAALVAGHSAHVFHGVAGRVLYDLGDFLDDYATDPVLRNDRGLVFLVELDDLGPRRVEAVPIALDHCHTRLADADEAAWIARRFAAACAALGTEAREHDGRMVVELRSAAARPGGGGR